MKSDEYIYVWSVFLDEYNSLLEVLLIIVCTICIRFLYTHPEKVFQSVDCVSTETCMFCPQNSGYDLLQMVGSHEANMTVGISQYISSDCHPELQSQMHSSLEDISVPQNSTFQNQIYGCHPTYLHFV